MCEGMITK